MMRAGKDYVGAVPEYEDKRSQHLRELMQTIKAQPAPAEAEGSPNEAEPAPKPENANQNKPTLKLTK